MLHEYNKRPIKLFLIPMSVGTFFRFLRLYFSSADRQVQLIVFQTNSFNALRQNSQRPYIEQGRNRGSKEK
jgi:hypothetical protein